MQNPMIEYFAFGNYIKERILSLDNSIDAVTLYNAIDLKNYSNEKNNRQSICKKFDFIDYKKTIMYVGRIQENKGVLDLVKAFINVDNNNLQLVLVGGSFLRIVSLINFIKQFVIFLKNMTIYSYDWLY